MSQLVRNYRIHLPGQVEAQLESKIQEGKNDEWVSVSLPPRKEWVAAVPIDRLVVVLTPR